MRVLVTWGSKRGGTAGIGRVLSDALVAHGVEVVAVPATVLAERIGEKGHVTFAGRLERDGRGFPASAMAKTRSGDWRNPDRIRAWAATLATG